MASIDSDQATQQFDDAVDETEPESSVLNNWGALVCGHRSNGLIPKPGTDDAFNVHTIGRNPSCDIVVDFDKRCARTHISHFIQNSLSLSLFVLYFSTLFYRISGLHCRILCSRSQDGREPFVVYLENQSGNGTFLRTAANPTEYISLEGRDGARRRLNRHTNVSSTLNRCTMRLICLFIYAAVI